MTSQGLSKGISKKHGQVEKGRHNFRKKSPFGIRLEYILKLLMTAYRKKTLKTRIEEKIRQEKLNLFLTSP